jgi:hypothetical protein
MKHWHPGTADEAWKVMICAQEAQNAKNALSSLHMMLTDVPGNPDAANEALRNMTGKQIVDGMLAYIKSRHEGVKRALAKAEEVGCDSASPKPHDKLVEGGARGPSP